MCHLTAAGKTEKQKKTQKSNKKVFNFYQFILTNLGHVHAVLGRGVVAAGGDGCYVHAVELPDGGVARVKVAAVGARRHVVGTLVSRPFAVKKERQKRRHFWMRVLTDALLLFFFSFLMKL